MWHVPQVTCLWDEGVFPKLASIVCPIWHVPQVTSPWWHVYCDTSLDLWTTLLQSWRTNSLLNVILMMRLNNNMSIWYRSSRYLSIKLMANTLGRLSLLNSFKSPGTFSETLDLDQKLQIILILQRQQYWHKHFPWFEQRFHCFTSPYWTVEVFCWFLYFRSPGTFSANHAGILAWVN